MEDGLGDEWPWQPGTPLSPPPASPPPPSQQRQHALNAEQPLYSPNLVLYEVLNQLGRKEQDALLGIISDPDFDPAFKTTAQMRVYAEKRKREAADDHQCGWQLADVTISAGAVPGLTVPMSATFAHQNLGDWLTSLLADPILACSAVLEPPPPASAASADDEPVAAELFGALYRAVDERVDSNERT